MDNNTKEILELVLVIVGVLGVLWLLLAYDN